MIKEFSKKFKGRPRINTNTTAIFPFTVVNNIKVIKVIKNMKRNLKQRGIKLFPIPEGDSMFILAPLRGKPVVVFSIVDVPALWSGRISQVSS